MNMTTMLTTRARTAKRVERAMAMSMKKKTEETETEKARRMRSTIMTSYFMRSRHPRALL